MSAMMFGQRNSEELVRLFIEAVAGQYDGSNPATAVTDANVLSVIRTIGEGVATLAERHEEEMLVRIASAIQQATYISFGVVRLPARAATGRLTANRDLTAASQTLSAGSRVRVPNSQREYITLADLVLPIGVNSNVVDVRAAVEGKIGNAPAGSITEIATPPAGAAWTITNVLPLTNGSDVESDEERALRFAQDVQEIHRATPDALERGVLHAALLDGDGNVIEAVVDAQVRESYGSAKVYLWNGTTTEAASGDLITRAQEIIDGYTDGTSGQLVPGYRAAGVSVVAVAATLQPVDVTVRIYLRDGYQMSQVAPSVSQAIRSVFARQTVGQDKLSINALRQAVGLTSGVVDHEFNAPTADTIGGNGVIIVPGTITVLQAT